MVLERQGTETGTQSGLLPHQLPHVDCDVQHLVDWGHGRGRRLPWHGRRARWRQGLPQRRGQGSERRLASVCQTLHFRDEPLDGGQVGDTAVDQLLGYPEAAEQDRSGGPRSCDRCHRLCQAAGLVRHRQRQAHDRRVMFRDCGRQGVGGSVHSEIDDLEPAQLQEIGDDAQPEPVMFTRRRCEQHGFSHIELNIRLRQVERRENSMRDRSRDVLVGDADRALLPKLTDPIHRRCDQARVNFGNRRIRPRLMCLRLGPSPVRGQQRITEPPPCGDPPLVSGSRRGVFWLAVDGHYDVVAGCERRWVHTLRAQG